MWVGDDDESDRDNAKGHRRKNNHPKNRDDGFWFHAPNAAVIVRNKTIRIKLMVKGGHLPKDKLNPLKNQGKFTHFFSSGLASWLLIPFSLPRNLRHPPRSRPA